MPQEMPQLPAPRTLTSAALRQPEPSVFGTQASPQPSVAVPVEVASQMSAPQREMLMRDFASVAAFQGEAPASPKATAGCVDCNQDSAARGEQQGFGKPSVPTMPTQVGRVSEGFLFGEGRLQVLGGPASPAVHSMNGTSLGLNAYSSGGTLHTDMVATPTAISRPRVSVTNAGFLMGNGRLQVHDGPVSPGVRNMNGVPIAMEDSGIGGGFPPVMFDIRLNEEVSVLGLDESIVLPPLGCDYLGMVILAFKSDDYLPSIKYKLEFIPGGSTITHGHSEVGVHLITERSEEESQEAMDAIVEKLSEELQKKAQRICQFHKCKESAAKCDGTAKIISVRERGSMDEVGDEIDVYGKVHKHEGEFTIHGGYRLHPTKGPEKKPEGAPPIASLPGEQVYVLYEGHYAYWCHCDGK